MVSAASLLICLGLSSVYEADLTLVEGGTNISGEVLEGGCNIDSGWLSWDGVGGGLSFPSICVIGENSIFSWSCPQILGL